MVEGRANSSTSPQTPRSPGSGELTECRRKAAPGFKSHETGGIHGQESLDGKTLYFADDNAVWSLPTDIGTGRTNPMKVIDELVYSTNFGLTWNGIYYMSAGPSPRQSTISLFDFRTREREASCRSTNSGGLA